MLVLVRHALITGAALTAMVAVVWPGAAGAHTEIQRSAPGPGAEVEGIVDEVELVFLDPVRQPVEIVVSALDGAPVADLGETALSEDRRTARVRFAPLVAAGPVLVEYRFVADDGAAQDGSYTFRFLGVPAAGDAANDPPGVGAAGIVGVIGFLAVAVGAGVMARFRAAGRTPSGAS